MIPLLGLSNITGSTGNPLHDRAIDDHTHVFIKTTAFEDLYNSMRIVSIFVAYKQSAF